MDIPAMMMAADAIVSGPQQYRAIHVHHQQQQQQQHQQQPQQQQQPSDLTLLFVVEQLTQRVASLESTLELQQHTLEAIMSMYMTLSRSGRTVQAPPAASVPPLMQMQQMQNQNQQQPPMQQMQPTYEPAPKSWPCDAIYPAGFPTYNQGFRQQNQQQQQQQQNQQPQNQQQQQPIGPAPGQASVGSGDGRAGSGNVSWHDPISAARPAMTARTAM